MRSKIPITISDENYKKLLLSEEETKSLKVRELRCPKCGFLIQKVYSDATGHISVKCTKCRQISIINVAYFKKLKRK